MVQDAVTSHMRDLLARHGINVNPSGRFPSERLRPHGSLETGTPAEVRDLAMVSYISAWSSFIDKTVTTKRVDL